VDDRQKAFVREMIWALTHDPSPEELAAVEEEFQRMESDGPEFEDGTARIMTPGQHQIGTQARSRPNDSSSPRNR